MRGVDPITRTLAEIQQRFAADERGVLADYIPQLATADPRLFGIALASLDGRIYQAGDALAEFTIQSVSKPFVHALALADCGLEAVLARVGAEPSGRAFNAASLDPATGRPVNPMINAGAIVTTSLVEAGDPIERFERIRAFLSAFAGHQLEIDEAVYQSEVETGDKNRSLAYLTRNAGALIAPVDETLDVYFRQCALLVTAVDLAVMAATLANGGVNPITQEAVVTDVIAGHVLSIMSSCGMYDYSGEWLLRVGLPAKSGVAGGLIAASPAEFGVGLFSPLLDERGNSVRGIEVCQELSSRLQLHLMHHPGHPAPVVYLAQTGRARRSSAQRDRQDQATLTAYGEAIVILGLQGDLNFAAAERVLNSLDGVARGDAPGNRWLIVDVDRVGNLQRAAAAMLNALITGLTARHVTIVAVDAEQRGLIPGIPEFSSLDRALQWCEDALLADRRS
jgi:glutaminase